MTGLNEDQGGSGKDVSKEAVNLFAGYVKKELEASEDMEELVNKHSVDEIERASMEVYDTLLSEVSTFDRQKRLYVILARVGDTINSQMMVEEGKKELERMMERESGK